MTPPGDDDWNSREPDDDSCAPGTPEQDSTDLGQPAETGEPTQVSPAAGLNEGERLPPEGGLKSTGLNERPPQPASPDSPPNRQRHDSPSRSPDNTLASPQPRPSGRQRQTDPVQESFTGQIDLYEIASWEVRSSLDRVAVRVTNALETSKRLVLLSLALTLFLVQIAIAGALVLQAPILGALAIGSVVPALVLAGYFWYGDPTMREPLFGLAVTFLLAVGFASVAGVINSLAQPLFQLFGVVGAALFYFLIVGPVEETVKWLAVRVYAYRTETFGTVIDGVVYGAMAGVGFAAIENLLYILMFSVQMTPAGFAVQQQQAVAIATQRAFTGPGHVIFSAWAGFYLGLAKFNYSKRGPIVVKGLMIAAFIHALYNTLVTTLPLSLPTFLAFLIIYHGFWFTLLYRKIRSYRSLYRRRGYPSGPRSN